MRTPPRVTVVTSRLDIGGTERHLNARPAGIEAARIDVTLYLMERGGPLEGELLQRGVRLEGPSRSTPAFLHWTRATLTLARFLRRERPAIAISFCRAPIYSAHLLPNLPDTRRRIMSRRSLTDYRAKYPLLRSVERFLHSRNFRRESVIPKRWSTSLRRKLAIVGSLRSSITH